MNTNRKVISIEDEPGWKAPGPGSWVRDRSHGPPNPTRLFRRIASEHTAGAYAEVMEELGGAIGTIDLKFVHGSLYRRLVPLVGAKFDRGTVPPNAALWLITRIHPAFRRRERTATESLANNRFEVEINKWEAEREALVAENLRLSAIEPSQLERTELAHHLELLDRHLVAGWKRHHQLHGSDLGPIGDLLVHTNDWGMDPVEVMGLLQGASMATAEAARHGLAIAKALLNAGVDPQTIDLVAQIQSVPAASDALADYLVEFGLRMVSSYDIEGRTLNELPSAICALVRRAGSDLANAEPQDVNVVDPTRHTGERSVDGSKGTGNQIPLSASQLVQANTLAGTSSDPALFHELLGRARRAYGLRDDNGPVTWEWPIGLMRRAYLAAGALLANEDVIADADLVFELDTPELVAMLSGDSSISDQDLEQRAAVRRWEADQDGPDFLGPAPTVPDLSALPPALARVMAIIVAATTMLEPDQGRELTDLTGLGIGSRTYQARARVPDSADEAIQAMMPGEVLVVAWTAPSFNSVLSIAGAAVVQEGGLLCHAAVMARELDIPAVVGCLNAMRLIKTGDLVEVDPESGIVRVLDTADSPE